MGQPRAIRVSVGVEWVNDYGPCNDDDVVYSDSLAGGFYSQMCDHWHIPVFNRGDGDVHEVHFTHPDLFAGGDAPNNVDAVNFFYFSGHSNNATEANFLTLGFGSHERACVSDAMYWKLGCRALKWIVFDGCDTVCNAEPEHVTRSWARPMKGVHLVFGFIGPDAVCWSTNDVGSDFADLAGTGHRLAQAWLYAASSVWTDNVPIAIAAGVDVDDAVDRREHETTDWRDRAITATNALAWMYREG